MVFNFHSVVGDVGLFYFGKKKKMNENSVTLHRRRHRLHFRQSLASG